MSRNLPQLQSMDSLAVGEKFEKDELGRWREAPAGAAIDRDKLKGQKVGR